MRLHNIGPKPSSKKRRRRIGRGISAGQGASGGFGMRGQKSRSGTGTKPGFEGGQMPLYRRVPKLKHFTVLNRKEYTIINVEKLAGIAANSDVTIESLMDAGIITTNDGPLKVLGNGDLGVALNVKAAAWSKSAQEKIEAAGGSISAPDHGNTDQ
ncbi:LSU ribosomal protein L15 RplO [Cyanobacterium sp. HL-69]|uniref:50S ribosomal protein L15 n=1 Tax=unclassified Cyanobacterium TaxID=2629879 RepID=UPI0008528BAC|nr:50S ribosomal protein L15 [Cyanobacterium sp. IPPAS B-1200]AUC59864.1 LSU ribosomal protein L15 RplO [Cyanobacterium sp. HL-69]OEJ79172.1 50S ribosomal protein L15 [Cyanobacterium sp. IPPAS B-1200]